jgi:hypothetical protein
MQFIFNTKTVELFWLESGKGGRIETKGKLTGRKYVTEKIN